MIDVRQLSAVRLDDGIATIGPGTRNIDAYARLAARGATIPSGSCPTVGIGGIATGGGMDSPAALGLTLDRIRALDVVTADEQFRQVSGRRPVLGAARGRRQLRRRHRPAARPPHLARRLLPRHLPGGRRAEALAAWDDLAPTAPADLTSILTLTASTATAFGQFLGSEARLRRLIRPLTRVPGASLSTGTSGYLALQRAGPAAPTAGSPPPLYRSAFAASSVYVARPLSAAGRRAFLDAAAQGATLILDAYGGAISRRSHRVRAPQRPLQRPDPLLRRDPRRSSRRRARADRSATGRRTRTTPIRTSTALSAPTTAPTSTGSSRSRPRSIPRTASGPRRIRPR